MERDEFERRVIEQDTVMRFRDEAAAIDEAMKSLEGLKLLESWR